MSPEIIEIVTPEFIVIEEDGEVEVVELPVEVIEVVEVPEQGPAGPSGTADFDIDLLLLYQIAKL